MPSAQLTPQQAESALTQIYDRFNLPENKTKLSNLVKHCQAEGNNSQNPLSEAEKNQKILAAKLQNFPRVISEMTSDIMQEYGFKETEMMAGIFQIQMHAMRNPAMTSKVGVLMKAFQGELEGEGNNGEGEGEEEQEAEECD